MFNKILTIASVFTILVTIFMYANFAKVQVVTDGLISYWTFDNADIQGQTVKDVVGNNDGTMMGDTKVVEGKIGQALEFDGDGDYVNCGDDASLEVSEAFTLAAWVNMSDFPGWGNTIISKWDDDEDQRGYMFNFGEQMEAAAADNEVAVILTEGGVWEPHCQWGTKMALELNQWYYIAITYDSSLAESNVKAYLNGELQEGKDWPNTVFNSDWICWLPCYKYETSAR